MDEKEVIEKILSDTKIWVAIFGFLGVLTGSTINFFIEWWKQSPKKLIEKQFLANVYSKVISIS